MKSIFFAAFRKYCKYYNFLIYSQISEFILFVDFRFISDIYFVLCYILRIYKLGKYLEVVLGEIADYDLA